MNALHDALALIERDAASDFHTTGLSDDLSPVTSAVRRARVARATATVGAAAAVVVGGVWALNTLGDGADADPASTPGLIDLSPTPSPAPSAAVSQIANSQTQVIRATESVEEIAWALATYYGVTYEEAEAALQDAVPFREIGIRGWLAPGAYELAEYDSPADFAQASVAARVAQLHAVGVPESEWQDTLTLASLVETAVPLESQMPDVAGTIKNRLAAGMPLELDATVIFAEGIDASLTPEEKVNYGGLYDTFKHTGLPPGPIAFPSLEAIDAAAHPADVPWLFFVTVNLETGETQFSETFEEHAAAVALRQEWIDKNGG